MISNNQGCGQNGRAVVDEIEECRPMLPRLSADSQRVRVQFFRTYNEPGALFINIIRLT